MLKRPEGIVDSQQHAALILLFAADARDSDLGTYQTEADADFRKSVRKMLEDVLTLRISSGATDAEVQAFGVSAIRGLAAQFDGNSFLEARRKFLEPKLNP